MSFHEYSSEYSPAMPICQVYLGPIGEEATIGPLEGIVDTGSDITIIPTALLKQIGLTPLARRRARSIWGESKRLELYGISFTLDSLRFQALHVLADDTSDEIVLGRFVLNRLKIVLDGPAGMLEIVEK